MDHHISDQTVGNILRCHDIAPAAKRSQTTNWREPIRRHMDVLAGTDFFTLEVLTWAGLATYVFVLPASGDAARKLGGHQRAIPPGVDDPDGPQCGGQVSGYLRPHRYVLHGGDYCADFRKTLAAGGVKCLRLPPRSPNLNAFAERWVRSAKSECLSHLILFGEGSLRRAMGGLLKYYYPQAALVS